MDRESLVRLGEQLHSDLSQQAKQYHVKSDAHEVLSWEAVGIATLIQALRDQSPLSEAQTESDLLSDWGKQLHFAHPELADRVSQFRLLVVALPV